MADNVIEIDFRNAQEKAHEIQDIAYELEKVISAFEDDISTVRISWQGDNANIFLKKLYSFEDKLKKSQNKAERSAIVISKIARNLYETEKRIQSIWK